MSDERITEGMIDALLLDPIWEISTTRNTRYDGLAPDGRRYAVVLAEDRVPPVIVTVFWVEA